MLRCPTVVKSQISQFQIDYIRKSWERTSVSDLAFLAKKCSKSAARKKVNVLGICHSILIDLGQDHQQHPTLHSGGIAGVGSLAVAVGFSDR